MSTIVFIIVCIILAVIIMSNVPGLEHFVKPLVDLVFAVLKVLSENGFAWLVFAVKALFSSHLELLEHLFKEPKEIDPTAEIRDNIK